MGLQGGEAATPFASTAAMMSALIAALSPASPAGHVSRKCCAVMRSFSSCGMSSSMSIHKVGVGLPRHPSAFGGLSIDTLRPGPLASYGCRAVLWFCLSARAVSNFSAGKLREAAVLDSEFRAESESRSVGSDRRRVQRVRTKSSVKVQLLKCAVFWLAGCWGEPHAQSMLRFCKRFRMAKFWEPRISSGEPGEPHDSGELRSQLRVSQSTFIWVSPDCTTFII
jgi:hypothetical protein